MSEAGRVHADDPAFHPDRGGPTPLRDIALGCIALLALPEPSPGEKDEEQLYLDGLRARLPGGGASPLDLLEAALQTPADQDIPLVGLARHYDLHWLEVLTLALCLAVEQEAMIGRVLAYLQSPLASSRPSLGLLEAAFGSPVDPGVTESDGPGRVAAGLCSGRALEIGLLRCGNSRVPLPEQVLSIPEEVALALAGHWQPVSGASVAPPRETLELPPSIADEATRYAAALAGSDRRALLVRSTSEPEARAIADLVARELDRLTLWIRSPEAFEASLGIVAVIARLLPVIQANNLRLEAGRLPELNGYDGPVIVVCEPEEGVRVGDYAMMDWLVPIPGADERFGVWSQFIGDADLAQRMARDHRQSAGRIAELAGAATREAEVRQQELHSGDDIRRAAWSQGGDKLGNLAVPVPDQISDDALVLGTTTSADLDLLLERCRRREALAEQLGVSLRARYQPGVRALFTGPSGTGKTLAAAWLATRLSMPLYRVDLASVISKYIGETEKNLANLLSRAERADVVLLFDEADSLFGKRTDIKDANDRYANTQTNYLLQRIETYQGIVVLTSNSRSRFDSAFTRRIDLIVEFPAPGPKERRSLWHSHLGPKHRLSAAQVNQLAATLDICGGHIRNAVLAAAVLARKEERVIGYDDVVQGLAIEYRKLARKLPPELTR